MKGILATSYCIDIIRHLFPDSEEDGSRCHYIQLPCQLWTRFPDLRHQRLLRADVRIHVKRYSTGPGPMIAILLSPRASRYVSSTTCCSTEVLRCKGEGDLRVPKVSLDFCLYGIRASPDVRVTHTYRDAGGSSRSYWYLYTWQVP
jgi:hypothetical protein